VGSISEIQGWFNNKKSVKIFQVYEKNNKRKYVYLDKVQKKIGRINSTSISNFKGIYNTFAINWKFGDIPYMT